MSLETRTTLDDATVAELGELLVDAVEGGASVSFLPGLAQAEAEAFWRRQLPLPARGAIVIARGEDGIDGCVMLVPAWAPNQAHRGEVAKLLVHRRARRRGLGRALMAALEAHARAVGLTLLTLDTLRGDSAERLYRVGGWSEAGSIPRFAMSATGELGDTVLFYKSLA
ncbi:MAG: GNAT family N-acetyltransferase [Deltaproteobacteria bacterium]|nr:GNAT family N-acetyltransferase [Deltaproteobacteria bacterium]